MEYIGSYTRSAFVNATISCVLNSRTNQLLIFELKVIGTKLLLMELGRSSKEKDKRRERK
jgi:hypothetical protein